MAADLDHFHRALQHFFCLVLPSHSRQDNRQIVQGLRNILVAGSTPLHVKGRGGREGGAAVSLLVFAPAVMRQT